MRISRGGPYTINWIVRLDGQSRITHFLIFLLYSPGATSRMSKVAADLRKTSLHSYNADLSSVNNNNSSVSVLQTEKDDGHSDETLSPCPKSEPTKEAVSKLHTADDDFPDGGLRAWLVILGVRP
jgi:hypothetical protein